MNQDLVALTHKVYPKVSDCLKGHIGEPVLSFFTENDDDRYYIMVGSRCSHCHFPLGGDDYANHENQERYYADLPPVPQEAS
jgi:hypothetical protein